MNREAPQGILIQEEFDRMSLADSTHELPIPALESVRRSDGHSRIEIELIELFEQFRASLLRYSLSFGISAHDGEEIIQETFLALFRHLQLGRSRKNLHGWIFRVVHNLALKQRHADKKTRDQRESFDGVVEQQFDPAPNPEEMLSFAQRRERLLAVVQALPEEDRNCLFLRAEGLRYREIAHVLGISLGAVSISLSRSLTRIERADRR
jgi:RNA polymerase sigma-70 factor, ECF subfamily